MTGPKAQNSGAKVRVLIHRVRRQVAVSCSMILKSLPVIRRYNNTAIPMATSYAHTEHNNVGLVDDVSIIQESARAKALAAMRDELQPRPPSYIKQESPFMTSSADNEDLPLLGSQQSQPSWHCPRPAKADVPGVPRSQQAWADITTANNPQQPARLNHKESTAYLHTAAPRASSSADAKPSVASTSSPMYDVGSSAVGLTWEGQKSAALLALEGERRQLQVRASCMPSLNEAMHHRVMEKIRMCCICQVRLGWSLHACRPRLTCWQESKTYSIGSCRKCLRSIEWSLSMHLMAFGRSSSRIASSIRRTCIEQRYVCQPARVGCFE